MNIKRFLTLLFLSSVAFSFQSVASSFMPQDSITLDRFFSTAQRLLNTNQLDSAAIVLKNAGKLMRVSDTGTAVTRQFRYLQLKGDFQFRKALYKECLSTANQMMRLSTDVNDPGLLAESLFAIALSESKLGQWGLAAEHVTQALKISEPLHNLKNRAKYYFFLSDVFFELREGDKSLYYSTKGYDLLKLSKDNRELNYRLNIILFEVLNNQLDLALRHLKEAAKNIDRKKDPGKTGKVYLYLSHIYYRKKQYDLSLKYLNQITPLLRVIRTDTLRLHTEMAMAQTYIELRNYGQARYYFEKSISAALKQMDTGDIKDVYLMGSKIYEGLNAHVKAVDYLRKYIVFSDSMNNLAMRRTIHETEIKYETTRKEKAISDQKLLLVNKDYELQKKNRYLLLGVSTIVLLVLSILIIYLVYRNKNQSVELSLLKAQIHPHFLFNTLNNLYALSIRKSDEAPGVVLGLANILRYILYECNTKQASLKKEMEVIDEYISLEKIRYADNLEVNTYIQGNLEGYTIAPLLLLPLVENAYKHGAGKLEKDSWINIEARIRGDRFLFKISNNKPLNKNLNSPKTKYGNIGLKNIQKRLTILYPKRHQFKITDSEDVFVVSLELDVKRKALKD
jgi:tetratricopeptide (TPR) repeat protein